MADEIAARTGKQYGDTEVHSGQVHLGDDVQYLTNNFTITKAIVSLPPQLRRKAERSRGRIQLGRSRTRGDSRTSRSRAERRTHLETGDRTPGAYPQQKDQDISVDLRERSFTALPGSSSARHISGIVPTKERDAQDVTNGYELLLVCAALLSLLVGRQVTAQQVLELFQQCRQDALFPLLTFLFGVVIHNYFSKSVIGTRSPTLPWLILEDCYGSERKVGFDVFSNFTTVKSFLHTHYTQNNGVAGAQLIQRGHFHLQLKSRHGRVLLKKNWASAIALLEHGSRVINSVYVTAFSTSCLSCSKPMITEADQYHCYDCHKFCRDLHSLEDESDLEFHCHDGIATSGESDRHEHHDHYENDQLWTSKSVDGVRDLQNINLRVLPHRANASNESRTHAKTSRVSDGYVREDALQNDAQAISTTARPDKFVSRGNKAAEHQPSKVVSGSNAVPTQGQISVQQTPKSKHKAAVPAILLALHNDNPALRAALVARAGQHYRSSLRPQTRQLRSIAEKFIFNLRRYTHAAHCFGHWDPNQAVQHFRGRQAARSFASELTAGKSLLEEGKTTLASGHFELACKRLNNPALFDTWYHETPIRLLFEVGRLSYSGYHDLASQVLHEIQTQSRQHLNDEDPRQAVFSNIGELDVRQLRELHALAARSVFYGLEAHYRNNRQLLYEVRLNRALDLSWFDPRADLSDWMPHIGQIEHDLGQDTPYAIYFLLLDAYRQAAVDDFDAAEKAWTDATHRMGLLQEAGIDIDNYRVGRGYRRLGQQLRDKKRFEDAGKILKHAFRLLENEKEKGAIMIELCQTYESIAKAVGDDADAAIWTEMLFQLEKQS